MNEEERKRKGWNKIGCLALIAAVIFVIIAVPAGIYGYYKYQTSKGINEAEKYISVYLEQKYHKKFNVFNGNYIWATSSYTFDASPVDDPEFKFPVFINKAFDKGVGDMYGLAREGRETEHLIQPYVEAISKNYFYSANFCPGVPADSSTWEVIKYDIRHNLLTPLQAAAKYPGKIYISTHISYCLDVTEQNKEQIFKAVYNLVEFLKQKGFGYIEIVIYFYPSNILDGKTIKGAYGDKYNQFENKYWRERTYSLAIGTKALPNINRWQDIENYFQKWDTQHKRWIKDTNLHNQNNQKNGEIK